MRQRPVFNELKKGMIVGIHKPVGMSSHDIVDAIRRITNIRKVGHAGTLDPLASGVLVVAIGRAATIQISTITAHEKEYIAKIQLGANSTTDDREGRLTTVVNAPLPGRRAVRAVLTQFTGKITQKPPIYSAVKVDGIEAYKLARKGQMPIMKLRTVMIHSVDLIDYVWPLLKFRAVTGPGVYVRALARDIGTKLHTGGFLISLERTRVGNYILPNSWTLEAFAENWKAINT